MVVAAMPVSARALQRRRHLVEAHRTVAVGIQFAEHVVGLRHIGAAGAERALEFGFADRAIAVAVNLREQILQRVGRTHAGRCRA